MLSYEEIISNISNYKIENGIVVDKKTNSELLDEDSIIRVKSSILIFKEAKNSYQMDLQQFGKTNKTQEDYIKATMEKFAVNNEINSYGINKLINSILSSNGHYEENMSGNDLQNSKFSFLVSPKTDYGLAYLKMKFRERGLDIENIKIKQDLTQLQKNGYSRVIIDFKIKKYEKKKNNQVSNTSLFKHPKATELNELEKMKQIAKQNNDEVGYNYAKNNIERIIRENQASVSPEQWDSMGIDERIAFVQMKINEAKVLRDKDSFNYWNANLIRIKNERYNNVRNQMPLHNSQTYNQINQEEHNNFTVTITKIKDKLQTIDKEYNKMLEDNYIDDSELETLIDRLSTLNKDALTLKAVAHSEKEQILLDSIIEMINQKSKMLISEKNKRQEKNHSFKR